MSSLLHVRESGPPDAPVLVFLHGFLGRGDDWMLVSRNLNDVFRCVEIDLPGHGHSLELPDEAYEWEGSLDGIEQTLDYLGIDRFRMIGYSMGGRLSIGFALRHPRRVARLVLVGAWPGLASIVERNARAVLDEERALSIVADLPTFVRHWYGMPLFTSLDDNPPLRAHLVDQRSQNDEGEVARALRGLSTGRMPAFWSRLDDLSMPTLAVAGAGDPKFVDLAYRMAAAGRAVMPLVLPNCGHLVPFEQPDLLAETIRDFCRDGLLGARPVIEAAPMAA